jgi:hypothetical protein
VSTREVAEYRAVERNADEARAFLYALGRVLEREVTGGGIVLGYDDRPANGCGTAESSALSRTFALAARR